MLKTHLYVDDWFVIQSELKNLHVDFYIYKIEGIDSNSNLSFLDKEDDLVEDISLAKPLITGYVKWDGCSNWNFGDDMMHFCFKESAVMIGTMLGRCYDIAKKEMGEDFFDYK